jgi:hypothetical protein
MPPPPMPPPSNGGKVTPNLAMDAEGTRLLNLTVLQRLDPAVEDILITAAHVTLYDFNIDLNQWVGNLPLLPRAFLAPAPCRDSPETSDPIRFSCFVLRRAARTSRGRCSSSRGERRLKDSGELLLLCQAAEGI